VNIRVNNVDSVFVLERCIGAFPGCDTATAVAECYGGLFHPCGAKSIEEIRLSCYFAVFEVGISELPDVDLSLSAPSIWGDVYVGREVWLTVSW
jgi:hypothetical protein